MRRLCGAISIPYTFPLRGNNTKATQSPWDIQICEVKFELKTATEDIGGNFQFNHIRYHREYDAVLCLGVSPNDLYFGLWSKADITTGKAGNLVSMEKGTSASHKLTKKPKDLFPILVFEEKIRGFVKNFGV